ncbi:Hypp7649 [Branchiostoma lanceolatum]|uniref:Hypp7649 protein n=1 Tax=Branchiostoma lanceolatum TaxID=7740 RepID=A0A8J9Z1U4_BRALA|nr:Hypp7649 [Branchiostoma lanceolatum]
MLLTNTRSLLNKMDEFQAVISTSAVDVAVVTETWFTPNLPTEAKDIPNYNLFSKCWSDRRGGGVAVYTRCTIPSKPLDIAVPTDLEYVWVQLRPHWLPRSVSSIALCAVYHPPNSTRDDVLLEFLADSIDDVRRQYSGVGVVVLGDFNRLDVSTLCSEHSLKPVVTVPTHKNATLDQVLASDTLVQCYQPPTADPPVGASDHNCVIWSGRSSSCGQNKVVKKVVRPLRQSDLRSFGSWITEHHWEEVYSAARATDKCSAFYSTMCSAIEKYFPAKTVRLHERDKPWMTPGLKAMILLRQKAFREQNLPEVKRLLNKIISNIQLLKATFYQQKVKGLKKADPKKWYQAIKEMGNMGKRHLNIDIPGVSPSSAVDVANAINTHLAAASQKHEPLRLHDLPAYLPAPAPPPAVSVWDMWNRLRNIKIGKAVGPDGISPRIIREFACELSEPLCDVMNTSLCQGEVPDLFKDADVVPIPKEMPPRLDKLRPISLTSIFAKVCEGIVRDWCLRDILPNLDPRQFGSLHGCSTAHYLARLVHNILEAADKPGYVTTLVLTDFSRAFDYVHHQTAICKLIDLGVRPSLVPWVSSFLSGRRQRVRYQGAVSDWVTLTCGVPQGTKLGPLVFLALVNDALPSNETSSDSFKYVDDISVSESRHVSARPKIREDIDGLTRWTDTNYMSLNPSKCKVMVFCFARNPPPTPEITVGPSQLEVVQAARILGVILQYNLKWTDHVTMIVGKGCKRLYVLRTLKKHGLDTSDLILIYIGFVRPVLEYACVIWHPGLTRDLSTKIERVQKRSLRAILGSEYVCYQSALDSTGLSRLDARRDELCLKFARSLIGSDRYRAWLPPRRADVHKRTLRNSTKLAQFKCRTQRMANSTLPYCVRLLNDCC